MDTIQLTPKGIPETSFADKAKEYQATLKVRTEIIKKVKHAELDIREFLKKHGIRPTEDLLGYDEMLKVLLPQPKIPQDGLVFVASKTEGRAFSEIAQNPSLLKKLEKKFGKNFGSFVRDVDDVFHYKEITPEEKIDEAKTKKLKEEYNIKVLALKGLKIDFEECESTLKDVKDYIAFCKELATLAPASPKDKGNQQKGQQQS